MNEHQQGMKTVAVLGILALAAILMPSPVAANKACTEDKAKFCSDVDSKDKEAMKTCLNNHYSDISADCQKELDQRKKGSVEGGDQGGSNTNKTGAPDSSSSSK